MLYAFKIKKKNNIKNSIMLLKHHLIEFLVIHSTHFSAFAKQSSEGQSPYDWLILTIIQ